MSLASLTARVAAGERLTRDQALALYTEAPTHLLGSLADRVRARKHPDRVVTYIIDRNVNYTNVCAARLRLLRLLPPVGDADAYVLPREQLYQKIEETIALGGDQILMQGGLHPRCTLEWYEDLFRDLKARFPTFNLHALSPPEIWHFHGSTSCRCARCCARLKDAGLDSMPGGGGEILVDRVREAAARHDKAMTDEWLEVMRVAHRLGMRTTATMMFGTRRDARRAHRAPAPAARPAGRDRRVHRVHLLDLTSPTTRSWRGVARLRVVDYLRTQAIAGCTSTTSRTSSRRG